MLTNEISLELIEFFTSNLNYIFRDKNHICMYNNNCIYLDKDYRRRKDKKENATRQYFSPFVFSLLNDIWFVLMILHIICFVLYIGTTYTMYTVYTVHTCA